MKPEFDSSPSESPMGTPRHPVKLSNRVLTALLTCAVAALMSERTVSMVQRHSALEEARAALAKAFFNQEEEMIWLRRSWSLISDLETLSKTDEDARRIVSKYKMRERWPIPDSAKFHYRFVHVTQ